MLYYFFIFQIWHLAKMALCEYRKIQGAEMEIMTHLNVMKQNEH